MRIAITLIIVVVVGSGLGSRWTAKPAEAADCRFTLGFQAIQEQIPNFVGDCKVNEHYNPSNGDALQETTKGLLVWRKLDNFTAFTDGYRTWVNGPFGLQQRLNAQRFAWELEISARNNPEAAVKADPSICDFLPGETTVGDPLGPLAVPCFNQYVASLPPLGTASPPSRSSVPRASVPTSVACDGSRHWIDTVLRGGQFILLEDGSLWEVSPLDRIDSMLWLTVDNIVIADGRDPTFPCQLINTSDRHAVDARQVRR